MALFTGVLLIDLLGFLVAIFTVIYAYFQWIYQTWKRKNIPYFEPSFPLGNKQPLSKGVPLGDDVFNTVAKAKKQGKSLALLFNC